MATTQQKSENQAMITNCPAFCPECKADLYYTDTGCICKSKECSWSCNECKKDN